MNRFDGRTAIVTGAGSGIGAATARRFSVDGANVVLAGRTREKLEDVAADLPSGRTLVQVCDVRHDDAVGELVAAAVERFAHLDAVVNNAGIARVGDVTTVAAEDFQMIQDVNVGGVFRVCRAAMPHLRERGGTIVNVSSVSGIGGDWGMAAYNASKAAVNNLTRAMALDHAADGVRVNAVAPSLTDTPMARGILEDPRLLARVVDRIPMGRAADPAEVADVIAFLCSRDARFVTGVVLPVDGGLGASNGQPRLG